MQVCKDCFTPMTPEMKIKSGLCKKTGVQRYRAVCKSCHSERVKHDQKETLIEKNPENYWQCSNCCLIVNKRFKSDGSCKRCGEFSLEDGNGNPFPIEGK